MSSCDLSILNPLFLPRSLYLFVDEFIWCIVLWSWILNRSIRSLLPDFNLADGEKAPDKLIVHVEKSTIRWTQCFSFGHSFRNNCFQFVHINICSAHKTGKNVYIETMWMTCVCVCVFLRIEFNQLFDVILIFLRLFFFLVVFNQTGIIRRTKFSFRSKITNLLFNR